MGKIYMTACMKGGCAKTVTTYNLAYSLKELGKKVLCVDFDSQANLSICFGVENPVAVPVTIGHLMMAQIDDDELPGFKEYIQSRNGVDFISSSMMLSAVDAKLRLEMGAEKMLSEILEPLRDRCSIVHCVKKRVKKICMRCILCLVLFVLIQNKKRIRQMAYYYVRNMPERI